MGGGASSADLGTAGVITAIVVHYNQPERCAATVQRLRDQQLPAEYDLRIAIVDNASTTEARRQLDRLRDVTILDAPTNTGYGGGANVGLSWWLDSRDGEWAVVVAHDAEPATDCLGALLAAVGTAPGGARIGLVSAEYGDDEVPVIDRYLGAMTAPAPRGTGWCPADYAHGTFLMLRRGCLEQVGLFDERYFAYCEEADLALRARRTGWMAGIVWGAVVHNPHQGSLRAVIDYLMVRNTIALVRTHFGGYRASIRFLIEAFTLPLGALGRPGTSPWFSARARALALRDAALGRMGAPPTSLLGVS